MAASSSDSDDEEKAKLREATVGALPVMTADKNTNALSGKNEKRNDFMANKLEKLLDDMIEYTDPKSPESSSILEGVTEESDNGNIKLLSSSKGIVIVTGSSQTQSKSH